MEAMDDSSTPSEAPGAGGVSRLPGGAPPDPPAAQGAPLVSPLALGAPPQQHPQPAHQWGEGQQMRDAQGVYAKEDATNIQAEQGAHDS